MLELVCPCVQVQAPVDFLYIFIFQCYLVLLSGQNFEFRETDGRPQSFGCLVFGWRRLLSPYDSVFVFVAEIFVDFCENKRTMTTMTKKNWNWNWNRNIVIKNKTVLIRKIFQIVFTTPPSKKNHLLVSSGKKVFITSVKCYFLIRREKCKKGFVCRR